MSQKDEEQCANENAWQCLKDFLHKNGERATQSRKIVLDEVMSRHDHFRAEELAQSLARGKKRVSRGTVYRTLILMEKAGLVRSLRDGDRHRHYEHTFGHGHHEHMVCGECGAFIEFFDPKLHKIIKQSCKANGFAEKSHRVVIFGVCKDCQKK